MTVIKSSQNKSRRLIFKNIRNYSSQIKMLIVLLLIVAAVVSGMLYNGPAFFISELNALSARKKIENKTSLADTKTPMMQKPATVSAEIKKIKLRKGSSEWTLQGPLKKDTPFLYKAIIDPEEVAVNDTQSMTLYVKDDKYKIKSVIARIQTDRETVNHPLMLRSGDLHDGAWYGTWTVRDTHETTYTTTFSAVNEIGKSAEARIGWTDPGCGCSTTAGAGCTISTTCSISGIEGNGGAMTITGSVTVSQGALVFSSLTLSGTVAASGGQIGTASCGNWGTCSAGPCAVGTQSRTCTWAGGGTVDDTQSCNGPGTWHPATQYCGYCGVDYGPVYEGWLCAGDQGCCDQYGICGYLYCHCTGSTCQDPQPTTNWGCCY